MKLRCEGGAGDVPVMGDQVGMSQRWGRDQNMGKIPV